MPTPKKPCPTCDGLMSPVALQCRKCKPTYERTAQSRANMSAAVKGKPKPHLRGRKRPDHARLMREYWTPERREEKKQQMLLKNPEARYHGLSARAAKRIVDEAGKCEACGHDGSQSRLGVHHKDRDKHNQERGNLQVLCHACHMKEHSDAGEVGWAARHRRR